MGSKKNRKVTSNRKKSKKKIAAKEPEIYMVTEYIIDLYAVFTAVANLLRIAGVAPFSRRFMNPTLFGISLLLLLFSQYELINANRKNKILSKMRLYVMGILAAGIVSVCNLSLCMLLFAMVGFFLFNGFESKFTAREALLMLLVTSVGMEIYSIAMLLQANSSDGPVGSFLSSLRLDIFFVLMAALYYIVVIKPEEEGERKEAKHFLKLRERLAWLKENHKRIVCTAGGAVCVLSLGLFLFFVVASRGIK